MPLVQGRCPHFIGSRLSLGTLLDLVRGELRRLGWMPETEKGCCRDEEVIVGKSFPSNFTVQITFLRGGKQGG